MKIMNKKYQQPTVAITHIITTNIIAESPTPQVTVGEGNQDPGGFESKERKDDKDNVWSEGLW